MEAQATCTNMCLGLPGNCLSSIACPCCHKSQFQYKEDHRQSRQLQEHHYYRSSFFEMESILWQVSKDSSLHLLFILLPDFERGFVHAPATHVQIVTLQDAFHFIACDDQLLAIRLVYGGLPVQRQVKFIGQSAFDRRLEWIVIIAFR